MLKAGSKTNVIPSEAEVQIDCRKLPGMTPQNVIDEILAITGDKVTLEPIDTSDGNASPVDTPFYAQMEKDTRQMDPDGIVIPLMMPGAHRCLHLQPRPASRSMGTPPGILPEDYPIMSMGHGHDERLPISYIRSGLPTLWQTISEFCGK